MEASGTIIGQELDMDLVKVQQHLSNPKTLHLDPEGIVTGPHRSTVRND
jgi:hypothetical protein